jgi:hypothetical protein
MSLICLSIPAPARAQRSSVYETNLSAHTIELGDADRTLINIPYGMYLRRLSDTKYEIATQWSHFVLPQFVPQSQLISILRWLFFTFCSLLERNPNSECSTDFVVAQLGILLLMIAEGKSRKVKFSLEQRETKLSPIGFTREVFDAVENIENSFLVSSEFVVRLSALFDFAAAQEGRHHCCLRTPADDIAHFKDQILPVFVSAMILLFKFLLLVSATTACKTSSTMRIGSVQFELAHQQWTAV